VTENIAGVSLPSLLIVPGAWHEPDRFCPLVDELSEIDVHTVTLPSSGKDPAVLGDMYAINATATDRNSGRVSRALTSSANATTRFQSPSRKCSPSMPMTCSE
jgi:hypothetical protein